MSCSNRWAKGGRGHRLSEGVFGNEEDIPRFRREEIEAFDGVSKVQGHEGCREYGRYRIKVSRHALGKSKYRYKPTCTRARDPARDGADMGPMELNEPWSAPRGGDGQAGTCCASGSGAPLRGEVEDAEASGNRSVIGGAKGTKYYIPAIWKSLCYIVGGSEMVPICNSHVYIHVTLRVRQDGFVVALRSSNDRPLGVNAKQSKHGRTWHNKSAIPTS